jgi:chromosome segregation ATPase
MHDEKRNETINQISKAIEIIKTLEGDNAIITPTKMMKYTNLSRSALYKAHALKIWNSELWEQRYVMKRKIGEMPEGAYKEYIEALESEIKEISEGLKKSQKLNGKVTEELEHQRKRADVYSYELEEIKVKHKKLLAECQRLNDILYAKS